MDQKIWRILVIDDKAEMTADAKRELEYAFSEDLNIRVTVTVENSFDDGYERVRRQECDVVILDVRQDGGEDAIEDEDAGRKVFAGIQETRFLPVIFWTARPQQVSDHQMPPLVSVFKKDDLALIPDAIRNAIASEAVGVMAGIEKHVADIMRSHMWQELAPNWQEDTVGGQADELARILITRVSQSLQDRDLPELTARPSHCYLYPPVSEKFKPGDLLMVAGKDQKEWWAVLTPACDLAIEGKADFALLGRARPLVEFPKYKKWVNNDNRDNWTSLASVLKGTQLRYHYFPAFREIPELLLDLEEIVSIPMSRLVDFARIASLVGPYSEALLVKHSHFRGRIGVPDLNHEYVREQLTQAKTAVN